MYIVDNNNKERENQMHATVKDVVIDRLPQSISDTKDSMGISPEEEPTFIETYVQATVDTLEHLALILNSERNETERMVRKAIKEYS